jgi:ferrous iron transport protein A
MATARTLADLRPGEKGVVVAVRGEGATAIRLMEMGLTPGVEVVVLKLAPLRDPIELRLRGFHLSVRRAEAARIEVGS